MAVRTVSGALRTNTGGPTNSIGTWMCWARRQGAHADSVGYALTVPGADENFSLVNSSDGTGWYFREEVANQNSASTTRTAGAWVHVCFVRRSTSDTEFYVDGTLAVDTIATTSTGAAPYGLYVGAADVGVDYRFNGDIAFVKAWSTALTADEVAQEVYSGRPVRATDLHVFYPLWGSTVVTEDWSGAGLTGVVVGSLTTVDGPPVGWGTAPVLLPQSSAAASGLTATPADSVTLSENLTISGGFSPAAFSDTSTVSDTATVSGAYTPAAFADTITATDWASGALGAAGALTGSVTDQVTLSDILTDLSGVYAPAVFAETVTTSDLIINAGISGPSPGAPLAVFLVDPQLE